MLENLPQDHVLILQGLGYETDGSFLSLFKLLPEKTPEDDTLLIRFSNYKEGSYHVEYGYFEYGEWNAVYSVHSNALVGAIYLMLVKLKSIEFSKGKVK